MLTRSRHFTRFSWIFATLGLVLAMLIQACEKSPAPAAKTPFRIAFNTWVGYSPLVIAKEKGFLAEEGLDTTITFLEGIAEKNSALMRGEIDGVGHTADSAVTSAAVGVDGQIVYVFDRSLGADAILSKSDIKTVADLKGKKVALEPGFTGHFFFLSVLKEAGLTDEDVTVVPMDTGSAGSTFIAGEVDAAVTWEPWIGKAKSMPDARILISSRERPGLIIDVLYMSRATIEKRSQDVQRLVHALGRATDWYLTNKDEGDRIMAEFWKLSVQETRDTVSGMEFMTLKENKRFFGTSDAPGQLLTTVSQANELWLSAKVIKQRIAEPKRLIFFEPVNAAAP